MGPDLDLAPLRTLVAIADCGTVTEAARRLHLSQPAATHQIRQLERALDVALFERVGRRLVLTEAGRLATGRARRIAAEIEGIRLDLEEQAQLHRGEIRIGGGATTTVQLLPRLIAAFREQHPSVSFYVREAATTVSSAAVLAGELDLAIVTLPCDKAGLACLPWIEEPIVFVGWPGSPLVKPVKRRRSPERLEPSCLQGAPFICAGPEQPLRAAVDAALQGAGVAPKVVMELESVEAIKTHVAAGLGYSALGAHAVARELRDGRLVALNLAGLELGRRLGIVHRAHAPLAPAVRAFLADLQAFTPA